MFQKQNLVASSALAFLLGLFFSCSQVARSPSSVTQTPFHEMILDYKAPQLFFSNADAFSARLKLLDFAPPGSKILISSFLFEKGISMRELSPHLCEAARRGVGIKLVVDSKSGGRAGVEDTFNRNDDAKFVEEIFQYLANCGVEVFVHNYQLNFVDIFGNRVPNIFLNPKDRGKSFGLFDYFKITKQIDYLLDRTAKIVKEEALRADIQEDPTNLIMNSKKFVLTFLDFLKYTERNPTTNSEGIQTENPAQITLERVYRKLVNDPIWNEISPEKLRIMVHNASFRFKNDPELGQLWKELRRFNRLNHRKLFLVETEDRKSGCFFLGGRNLGDNYLRDENGTFLDGEVFLCRHHGAQMPQLFDEVSSSVEKLIVDKSDPFIGLENDNEIIKIQPNPNFVFKEIRFPDSFPESRAPEAIRPWSKRDKKALIPPRSWADHSAIPGVFSLEESRNWSFLKAGWDPSKDEVKANLLQLIKNEAREIFIETPYAQFSPELRSAIEKALQRGVRVSLITNSLFISDGLSKIIRVLMARWMERTKEQYPDLFQVRYVTLAGGRMTHFKGAAFGCQKGKNGNFQVFIIGSHNFDPRSGRSDKDHALRWEENWSNCESLLNSRLVSGRMALYASLANGRHTFTLAEYPDILKELEEVVNRENSEKDDLRRLATSLKKVFYEYTPSGYRINQAEKVKRLLKLMEEGGLGDLLGQLF